MPHNGSVAESCDWTIQTGVRLLFVFHMWLIIYTSSSKWNQVRDDVTALCCFNTGTDCNTTGNPSIENVINRWTSCSLYQMKWNNVSRKKHLLTSWTWTWGLMIHCWCHSGLNEDTVYDHMTGLEDTSLKSNNSKVWLKQRNQKQTLTLISKICWRSSHQLKMFRLVS